MALVAFLHSPCHVPQAGRVHFVHYRCSLESVAPGTVHHHALLPGLGLWAIPIPAPPASKRWTLSAADWAAFYSGKEIPLVMPGQALTVPTLPMATRRRRAPRGGAQ